ncbi:MAG TPA: vitamin K epoxide reductase family protein [Candidatus Paceibacterota bacterium]|nr:vitamin K epoxide reductase family protein [Candidatus Paceibacterota bacterium]
MNFTVEIILILLGLAGLSIAAYIRHTKLYAEKLICPIGFDCNAVVKSDYSRFLGIPVELIGTGYYTLVAIGYFLGLFQILPPGFVFLLAVSSLIAFLFSLYLTAIQAFLLRQWCSWCLISAGLSTIIFLTIVFFSDYNFVSLLAKYKSFIVVFHALAAALGVGAVTVANILFFQFLRDSRISEEEAGVFRSLSQTIWLALGLFVISGIGLYLPESIALLTSAKFLAKLIVTGVILINGLLLNVFVAPRLTHISFGETHPHQIGELRRLRRLAFGLGAVSIVSWYSIFILGSLSNLALPLGQILGVYFLLVIFGIFYSQYYEHVFARGQSGG